MEVVLQLVAESVEKDRYGVEALKKTPRTVYATVESVTRREFYDAGRNGLNPSFVFKVFFADYEGERECLYDGNRYAIYRSYRVPGSDYLELYVQREGGVNSGDP